MINRVTDLWARHIIRLHYTSLGHGAIKPVAPWIAWPFGQSPNLWSQVVQLLKSDMWNRQLNHLFWYRITKLSSSSFRFWFSCVVTGCSTKHNIISIIWYQTGHLHLKELFQENTIHRTDRFPFALIHENYGNQISQSDLIVIFSLTRTSLSINRIMIDKQLRYSRTSTTATSLARQLTLKLIPSAKITWETNGAWKKFFYFVKGHPARSVPYVVDLCFCYIDAPMYILTYIS